jgi:hypothetical protein
MAISIKNENGVTAIERLAEYYGVGYSAAVEAAARDILGRPNPTRQQRAIDEASRVAADCRRHWTGAPDTAALYDEAGLYR